MQGQNDSNGDEIEQCKEGPCFSDGLSSQCLSCGPLALWCSGPFSPPLCTSRTKAPVEVACLAGG